MARQISNVLDIKLKPKKPWTVLVQVLEHGHVQVSQSANEFKRLVLVDSEGTKLTALIYGNNVRHLANLLTQYKRYYISNAVVVNNDQKYRISSYPCSWVLNNTTLIEELVDPIPKTLTCKFNFTKFSDLHKFADTDTLHDIRAIVLQCFPSKEQGSPNVTTRDIVIVNEERQLLLLTLWNTFDDNEGQTLSGMVESPPMIFGLRLKVTTFYGLSLTTRASSGFMINPPVTNDLQMQEWYSTQKQELQHLLDIKSYKNTDILLPYPKEEGIISIATAIASFKTRKTAWVKGKTSLPKQERSSWYTACGNCQKALEADLTWVITCPSCRIETHIQALSRITIQIEDGTGSVCASVSTPDAEKLMSFTATELKEAEENSIDLHDDIAKSLEEHTIIAFIRSYETTFHNQSQMKMNIVKAYKVGEVLPQSSIISQSKGAKAYVTTLDLAGPSAMALQQNKQPSESISDLDTSAKAKGEAQLFTPSTKLALEEVSSTLTSKSLKKRITFSDDQLTSKPTGTSNQPHGSHVSTKNQNPLKDAVATLATKKNEPETRMNEPIPVLTNIKKEMGAQATHTIPTRASIKKDVGAQVMDESPTKKTKKNSM